MKTIFYYAVLFSFLFFMQGCSSDGDIWSENSTGQTNFPKQSEEYGKAVAKEIRETVYNLNKMGVDYSRMDKSRLKEQFYKDLDQASPILKKSGKSISEMQMSIEEFADEFRSLTAIQLEYIARIDKEYKESLSIQDFLGRLISINKDIYLTVPEIEQERLFNTTAILFYGLKELQEMEKQGQMFPTSYNIMSFPRLKAGSESGGGFWGSCREVLSSVSVAIGTRWATGDSNRNCVESGRYFCIGIVF